MLLITKEQREQLLKNGRDQDGTKDFKPVIKLFTPDANCTWLISELDPEYPDIAFGLCDLGMGFPEMGNVAISEIKSIKGVLGLPVERDGSFTGIAPLTIYWRASQENGQIVTSSSIINAFMDKTSN